MPWREKDASRSWDSPRRGGRSRFKIRHRPPCKSWSGYQSGLPWRPSAGGGGGVKGSDEDENLFARVYNLAGKQLRADRLIDQWIDRSLARSRDARMSESCVTTTARALYTRCARDTRTLATIAGSALTRGGARTFSSWRYRAASRRPPAFRPSLPSLPPTPRPGERRRPPGGAAPGPQRISRCPLRSTMPAIGAPGARTVNQKNAR